MQYIEGAKLSKTVLESIPSGVPIPEYALSGNHRTATEWSIHDSEQLQKVKKAATIASEALTYAGTLVEVGKSTDEIDIAVRDWLFERKVYPAPLGFMGFPKHICTSVNNQICHGIPNSRRLCDGDVLSIDISIYTSDDVYGDNCRTFLVGENVSEADRRLAEGAMS